jgi:hypothetical protein
MPARIPIVSVVLLTSTIALVAAVLAIIGAPMAGTASALAAVVGAVGLTIPMAFVFSHGPHPAKVR